MNSFFRSSPRSGDGNGEPPSQRPADRQIRIFKSFHKTTISIFRARGRAGPVASLDGERFAGAGPGIRFPAARMGRGRTDRRASGCHLGHPAKRSVGRAYSERLVSSVFPLNPPVSDPAAKSLPSHQLVFPIVVGQFPAGAEGRWRDLIDRCDRLRRRLYLVSPSRTERQQRVVTRKPKLEPSILSPSWARVARGPRRCVSGPAGRNFSPASHGHPTKPHPTNPV